MTENVSLTFTERLAAAAASLSYLEKKGFNSHFKYKFVSEADVKAAVKTALAEHGLVLQLVRYSPIGECTGKSAVLSCEVRITSTDASSEGEAVYSGIGGGSDSSDKAPMKACAAALKYALTSGFLIPTGDDPENDDDKPTPKNRDKTLAESEAVAKAVRPTTAPKPNGATASTQAALKAMDLIKNARDLAALNAQLDALVKLKADMSEGDYDLVKKAFKETQQSFGGK